MKEKLLVTGATGNIGANLVADLLKRGYAVTALTSRPPGDPQVVRLRDLGVGFIYGDLRDYNILLRAVKDADAIFHLAAIYYNPWREVPPPDVIFDVNVRGTFNILEAIKHDGSRKKLIFASSGIVYGLSEGDKPIIEDIPLHSTDPYGISKVLGERVCFHYETDYKIPIVIFRFTYVYVGDDIVKFFSINRWIQELSFPHKASFSSLRRAAEGKDPSIPKLLKTLKEVKDKELLILRDKEGKPWKIDVCDVRDTVQSLILALEKRECTGVFNITGPSAARADEIVHAISEASNMPYFDVEKPIPWLSSSEVDISKAKRELGFKPRFDLKRMVADALAFRRGEDIGVIATSIIYRMHLHANSNISE